jgi:hypothetical protein
LRKVSSAYAMPEMSSSAAAWAYGHATAGGSSAKKNGFLSSGEPRPRLSLDMSDGSDVKSVRALVAADANTADSAGAEEEELSVNGDGGVAWPPLCWGGGGGGGGATTSRDKFTPVASMEIKGGSAIRQGGGGKWVYGSGRDHAER